MGAGDTRRQIVEAADRLFYERGFESTSFADIAQAVGLSRGNFYYHFKAKDEILAAVVELRIAKTRAMLEGWDEAIQSPQERIRAFVHILIANKAKIMAHGCPVGALCNELARLDHVAKPDAVKIFCLFREWLARQFAALGAEENADALAMHILMRSQGVATLAAAFRDEEFIRREVEAMNSWLESVAPSSPNSGPA